MTTTPDNKALHQTRRQGVPASRAVVEGRLAGEGRCSPDVAVTRDRWAERGSVKPWLFVGACLSLVIAHSACTSATQRVGAEMGNVKAAQACQEPIPSDDPWPPSCEMPSGCSFTLAVEIDAKGHPGRAYAEDYRSASLDACLTNGVRGRPFMPARDCRGRAMSSVWKQRYGCTDDISGAPMPVELLLPPIATQIATPSPRP